MKQEKNIEQYVKDYLKDNSLDYKAKWSRDIIIEIACEIGQQILIHRHPDMDHFVQGKEQDQECCYYTEESQDLFNTYYDEVEAFLKTKTLK